MAVKYIFYIHKTTFTTYFEECAIYVQMYLNILICLFTLIARSAYSPPSLPAEGERGLPPLTLLQQNVNDK
jgi:hypothetical protein